MNAYIPPIACRPHFFEEHPDGETPEFCICGRHENDPMHVGMVRRVRKSQDESEQV